MTVPPSSRRWVWPAILIALAACWGLLCWPWLSGRVTVPWDAKAHFYPQLVFMAQSFAAGDRPWWNPFIFSGSPQVADPQSLIFSPPHYLLAKFNALPSFQAADAVPFAALLLGAAGVALYFRDRNWHPAGALVAALAFAFGGAAAWRIQHTGQIMSLAYFPLVLWLYHRALDRSSILYGALAGMVAAFLVLGRDQVAGLCTVVLIAYAAAHALAGPNVGARIVAGLRPVIAGVTVGGMIIAIPVIMTLVLAADSNRAAIDFEGAGKGSLHPSALLTFFLANLYGTDGAFKEFWGAPSPLWGWVDLYIARNMSNVYSGAAVILCLVFGLASGILWRRGIRFFTIALVAILLYTLGRYTPFFRLAYDLLPWVDLFRRPADGTFLIGALAAYCAGYVVHVLASEQPMMASRAGRLTLASVFAAVLAGIALAIVKGRLGYAWPMILEGAGWLVGAVLVLTMFRNLVVPKPALATALLCGFLVADLARNNGPNESTALPPAMYDILRPGTQDPVIAFLKDRTRAVTPDRRDRVELAAIDFHAPNASMIHRLDNTLGYNPLRDALYSRAVGAGDHIALPDQRAFPPTFPGYSTPLARLLGLRYIATGVPLRDLDKSPRAGDLVEVLRTNTATIYENPGTLSRVMVVPKAEVVRFADILDSGVWPREDFQDTVLIEQLPAGAPRGQQRGTARITSMSNTEIWIEVDAPDGGYVVLNDPLHPWWRGYINRSITQMLRVNVMFRAVAVPPGKYTVTFVFQPLRGLFDSVTDKISGRKPI